MLHLIVNKELVRRFSITSKYNYDTMKKVLPYLLLLFGLLFLILLSRPVPAGIFILVGIVCIIEKIWPEKWMGVDK